MTLQQLSFDFTSTLQPRAHVPPRPCWQVATLQRRHALTNSQAIFYAEAMGVPVRGVRS